MDYDKYRMYYEAITTKVLRGLSIKKSLLRHCLKSLGTPVVQYKQDDYIHKWKSKVLVIVFMHVWPLYHCNWPMTGSHKEH